MLYIKHRTKGNPEYSYNFTGIERETVSTLAIAETAIMFTNVFRQSPVGETGTCEFSKLRLLILRELFPCAHRRQGEESD